MYMYSEDIHSVGPSQPREIEGGRPANFLGKVVCHIKYFIRVSLWIEGTTNIFVRFLR